MITNQTICDAILAQAKHGWDHLTVPQDPTDYTVTVEPEIEDQEWWNEMSELEALGLLEDQPLFLGRDRESLEWEQQELAEAGIVPTYPRF